MKRHRLFAFVLSILLCVACMPGTLGSARAASDSQYYIEVDISNQVVTVYDAASMEILRQMLCSTGEKSNWTPRGDFYLPEDEKGTERDPWYKIGEYYVRFATRITGQILFHSIPYDRRSLSSLDPDCVRRFGFPASHGCVRLRWQDARYIAENCPAGTHVKIFESGKRDDELRALLYQQSFDASRGFSYDCFLGISDEPDVLDRRSTGQEVLDLQYRLRDLGLYAGEMNGVYDSATVNAVRIAQYMLGSDASGLADSEFMEVMFSDGAPLGMNVRLESGMSGPAVRQLQKNLQLLRLYKGELDSVYDLEVADAVKQFQRAYCYQQDGIAAPEVQKAIAYEVENLTKSLGGLDYDCKWDSEPLRLAKVKAEAGLSIRRTASSDSRQLEVLSDGESVVVLEVGKNWSKVRSDDHEGYVLNRHVSFFEKQVDVLSYSCPQVGLSYTVGNRASDYYNGANLPCKMFDKYLIVNDDSVSVEDLVSYVTVETGSAATLLNLREAPDADSAVLNTVGDGSSLKVQKRFAEWTEVTYQGQSGYLMNCYLNFWTGPQDALENLPSTELVSLVMPGTASVKSATGSPAGVYADSHSDAQLLGHLSDGVEVEVLEDLGTWCHIRYQDHEGYMISDDLFLEEEPVDNRMEEELRV